MKLRILALIGSLLLASTTAIGSGGGGGGGSGGGGGASGGGGAGGGGGSGGGGSSGGGGGGDGYRYVSDYDMGKKVFQRKLYCQSCPLSDFDLDRHSVLEILPKLSEDGEYGKPLTSRERRQVIRFLKKRFDI